MLAVQGRPGADIIGPEFCAVITIVPTRWPLYFAISLFMAGTLLASLDLGALVQPVASGGSGTGEGARFPPMIWFASKIAAVVCTGLGALVALKRGIPRFLAG